MTVKATSTDDHGAAPRRPGAGGRLPLAVAAAALLAHGASLANGFAWDDRNTVVANPALRSLGAKSDQLVPELARQPSDGTRSRIRPVLYPRSRHGFPVRE